MLKVMYSKEHVDGRRRLSKNDNMMIRPFVNVVRPSSQFPTYDDILFQRWKQRQKSIASSSERYFFVGPHSLYYFSCGLMTSFLPSTGRSLDCLLLEPSLMPQSLFSEVSDVTPADALLNLVKLTLKGAFATFFPFRYDHSPPL